MTELSPLDILGKTFSSRLRGYAPEEVHEFLSLTAAAMEGALRERGELRQQLHRLEQQLVTFRERETALQEALVAAQRSAENTLAAARSEAQKIVEEGHNLADRLVDDAHQRAHTIETVISELRSRRRETRAELMRLVEVLNGVVEDDHQLEKDERSTPQIALLHRTRERTSSKA